MSNFRSATLVFTCPRIVTWGAKSVRSAAVTWLSRLKSTGLKAVAPATVLTPDSR